MPFRALVVPMLAVGALLAAGCAGDDDGGETTVAGPVRAEPQVWAEDVCTALQDWQQGLEERAQSLQADVFGAGGLSSGRDAVVAFLDDAVAMTEDLQANLESAGVPAVDDGPALMADLQSGVEEVSAILTDAKEDVESAPPDPEGLETALTDIGSTLGQEGARISESFAQLDERYDVPELDAAFENAEACAGIQG